MNKENIPTMPEILRSKLNEKGELYMSASQAEALLNWADLMVDFQKDVEKRANVLMNHMNWLSNSGASNE